MKRGREALRTCCPLCDEWYDPQDPERARVHDHPEPQSGEARRHWLASRLSYARWCVEAVEGKAWAQARRDWDAMMKREPTPCDNANAGP